MDGQPANGRLEKTALPGEEQLLLADNLGAVLGAGAARLCLHEHPQPALEDGQAISAAEASALGAQSAVVSGDVGGGVTADGAARVLAPQPSSAGKSSPLALAALQRFLLIAADVATGFARVTGVRATTPGQEEEANERKEQEEAVHAGGDYLGPGEAGQPPSVSRKKRRKFPPRIRSTSGSG